MVNVVSGVNEKDCYYWNVNIECDVFVKVYVDFWII